MRINKIDIKNFKAVKEASLVLGGINVIVGQNNAGKSCVLQAVHFAVSLMQTAKQEGAANFSSEKLRYIPTENFLDLKNGQRLTEGSRIEVTFHSVTAAEEAVEYCVFLTRGRNGTISTTSPNEHYSNPLRIALSNQEQPFSIYVPGLAGIPAREEYRGKLVVDRGAGRGDANLFLRDVLLRLYKDQKKKALFQTRLQSLFPAVKIAAVEFNEDRDDSIRVNFTRDGSSRPIDMIGTGTLQAIQILSYATYYEPALLLLDEPDAHLHPDNQKKLIETLLLLTKDASIQVVMATHSRHLLQMLHGNDDVTVFRLKDGSLHDCEEPLIDLLMDLGAIDKYDNMNLLGKRVLLLSEDELVVDDEFHPMRLVLKSSGVDINICKFMAYVGCTNFRSVSLLASFVAQNHPGIKVLVHRDRDFLQDKEIDELLTPTYSSFTNVTQFITEGSDIESYFVRPEFVAEICSLTLEESQKLLEQIAFDSHNALLQRFTNKRNDLKSMFKSKATVLTALSDITPSEIPLPASARVSKDMLGYLRTRAQTDKRLQPLTRFSKVSLNLADQKLVDFAAGLQEHLT